MPRMTRAKAAEVADKLHVDEDTVLELPTDVANLEMKTPEPEERAPLDELAPNSGGSKEEDAEMAEMKKSTRSRKGGRKAIKGKKEDLAGNTASRVDGEDEAAAEGAPDQQEAARSPASEHVQDLLMGLSESQHAASPATSLEPATKPAETESSSLHILVEPSQRPPETDSPASMDAPPSPPPTAVPNVIASLRKDTPGKRSTSNKENIEPMASPMPSSLPPRPSVPYDALEQAVVQAATPPGPSRRPSTMELPVSDPAAELQASVTDNQTKAASPGDAMDALEDALRKVALEVPNVQSTPEKLKAKKATPVVRTTKASLARFSLAQAEKNGATASKSAGVGRARPSGMLGRASSVRQSTATRHELAGKRVPSTGTKNPADAAAAAAEPREREEVVIPHAKPRPVSISFPTPPPPPKSTKAPTTSTFQLPGEAVAAKLKAAREERAKKKAVAEDEQQAKKAAFKALPVPAGLSKAPSVRQTNASKSRESLMRGKLIDGASSAAPGLAHKRANSAITSSATKPLRAVSKGSSQTPTKPRTSLRPPPTTTELKISKRPSTAVANIGKPRQSTSTTTSTTNPSSTTIISTAPPASGARIPSGKGTAKGREVFSRPAFAKEAAEKEKREKEEAARKARVAAAERGRKASREWAEKKEKARKASAAVGKAEGSEPAAAVGADEGSLVGVVPGEGVVG